MSFSSPLVNMASVSTTLFSSTEQLKLRTPIAVAALVAAVKSRVEKLLRF